MGRTVSILAVLGPLLLGSLCEGTGSERPGVITQAPIDPRCTPIGGPFPSGFDLLPGPAPLAVAVRFHPAGLLRFDLSTAPPTLASTGPVPVLSLDSDGDGRADDDAYRDAGLCPAAIPLCVTAPVIGRAEAGFPDLVFVTASGYEEVLFLRPGDGTPRSIRVANPADVSAHRAADRPLAPAAGTSPLRTALSTLVCVYPPDATDSNGDAIPPSPHCDPGRTGFLTRFTAATAVSDDRLFVASSNLASSSRASFHPGTVQLYALERDAGGGVTGVSPDVDVPVVFTTAFNPTGLTAHRTPAGRDVVLITLTGAIDVAGTLLGDAAIDVLDVASRRIVATIPLGRAGAVSGELSIDPGGHVALLGAESARNLYAVDLASLDDPALYASGSDPVALDGSTPGFADARIFAAGRPFALPRRPDGPPDALCTTRTQVTLNRRGDLAYTTDWCDGTLSVVALDWQRPLERPISPARFRVVRRLDLFAPKTPANFGRPAAPGLPRTRPGIPGVDFDGPDVFFLINEPEGQLCAVRVEP